MRTELHYAVIEYSAFSNFLDMVCAIAYRFEPEGSARLVFIKPRREKIEFEIEQVIKLCVTVEIREWTR